MIRVIAAFILSPAIGLLALGAVISQGPFAFVVAVAGGVIAYPCALLVGVPLFVMLRRRNMLEWWRVVGAGAIVGMLGSIALALLGWGGMKAQDATSFLAMSVVVGVITGAVFWITGVYRNPALAPAGLVPAVPDHD